MHTKAQSLLLSFLLTLFISCEGGSGGSGKGQKQTPNNTEGTEQKTVETEQESNQIVHELPEGPNLIKTTVNQNGITYDLVVKRAVSFDESYPSIKHLNNLKKNLNHFVVAAYSSEGIDNLMKLTCQGQDNPGLLASSVDYLLSLKLGAADNMKSKVNCFLEDIDGAGTYVSFRTFELKKDLFIDPSATNTLASAGVAALPVKPEYGLVLIKSEADSSKRGLFTNGANFNIKADQIIVADKVVIRSHQNQKAVDNTVGKSGGSLTLNAKYAYGKYDVVLNGQDGGNVNQSTPARDYKQVTCDNTPPEQEPYNPHAFRIPTIHYYRVSGKIPAIKPIRGNRGGDSGKILVSIQKKGSLFELLVDSNGGTGSDGKSGIAAQSFLANAHWTVNARSHGAITVYAKGSDPIKKVTAVNPECNFLVNTPKRRDRIKFNCTTSNCLSPDPTDTTNLNAPKGADGNRKQVMQIIEGIVESL